MFFQTLLGSSFWHIVKKFHCAAIGIRHSLYEVAHINELSKGHGLDGKENFQVRAFSPYSHLNYTYVLYDLTPYYFIC